MAGLGQVGQQSANAAFIAMGSEVFARADNQSWQEWVKQVPCDGTSLEVDLIGPSPEVREMTTTQRFASWREYARRKAVVPYSADALEISRTRVDGDKSGTVEMLLKDYLESVKNFMWAPAAALLVSNPVGIDGVSILNDTHPYGASAGTWDNKVTTAFSQAALATGVMAFTQLQLENGAPAMVRPTHLVVHPALERDALDATGAQRAVPVDNAGAINTAANVVAAVLQNSWIGGQLKVLVEPRLTTATDWLLMDLSKPGAKPIVAGMQSAPEPIVRERDGESYFQRDVYQYTVRARAALAGFVPHVIYGRIG